MPRYYVWTIGCQMNKADSDHVIGYLERAGYSSTDSPEHADFILVNSCVVRQNAEDKVLNKLMALKAVKKKARNTIIALTGCLVDSRAEELKQRFPWLDIVFRPREWEAVSRWAEARGLPRLQESDSVLAQAGSVTAYVPAIHGCNNFCSYCIVPYRRGRERSRDLDEIWCHVKVLVDRGVKEVTLLGQNIGAYGRDLPYRPDLADLLTELDKIQGLLRIRFLTNHPRDVSEKLIRAVGRLEKVCKHISLPMQAGDNDILRAMRRGYTVEQYADLVGQVRSAIPQVALSTDVIVGFPNESDEQYENTLRWLRELRFDRIHVAAYSPRPGTIASRKFPDNVPAEKKKLRLREIESLHESIASEINAQSVGQSVEVLVEGKQKGRWQGRTRGDKLVFFTDKSDADLTGQLVNVTVEKASAWALQGSRV